MEQWDTVCTPTNGTATLLKRYRHFAVSFPLTAFDLFFGGRGRKTLQTETIVWKEIMSIGQSTTSVRDLSILGSSLLSCELGQANSSLVSISSYSLNAFQT